MFSHWFGGYLVAESFYYDMNDISGIVSSCLKRMFHTRRWSWYLKRTELGPQREHKISCMKCLVHAHE